MDFDLPADLEEYRKQVREFSLREFTEETAMMHDIKEKYPDELRKKALERYSVTISSAPCAIPTDWAATNTRDMLKNSIT